MRNFIEGIFAPKHLAPSIEEHAALTSEVEDLRKQVRDHARRAGSFTGSLADLFAWTKPANLTHDAIDETLALILAHLNLRIVDVPGSEPTRVLEPTKPAKRTRARR